MLEGNKDQLQREKSGKAFLSKRPFNLRPKEKEGVHHLKRTGDQSKRENLVGRCPSRRERAYHISVSIYNIGEWNIINQVKSCER